jgi:nitrogenase molybdenum-iron protein alpha/beta subunit
MSASLKQKIAEVFDEPGCDKNVGKSEKERKKGCTKQLSPGAAAGGCAFDGAKIALQPIVDVAHLVHGPIACEGNSWDNRHSASSGSQLYRTGFTTDINELDVVYGGEKRLFKSVREIIEKYNPPAVFVYQTCVTALIGDDIEAVCKRASEKFGKPVIPVNSPGFAGPKNLGNKLGGESVLDYVIGTEEPEFTTPYDINIIGEYNLSGELWQIARLLVQTGAGADLIDRTERLIEVEEARAWKRLEKYKDRLKGKRVLLITGGVKSWSVVSALQEVGMEIVGTSIKKSTKEDKEKIKEIMGDDAHMIDDMTPREMYNMLRDAKADIMLSGGRSQFIALKARMPWLDINQERHHAYAGYEGMVELVEEIDKALYNPVWEQVRIPAPWDEVDAGMLEAEPFVRDMPPAKAGGHGGGDHDHGHDHAHGHAHA